MSSQVDIVNVALGHTAAPTISDMGEKSNEATEASRFWLSSLKAVLSAHDWRFASSIRTLTKTADVEKGGWTYTYTYPPDSLKFREILTYTNVPVGVLVGQGQAFGSALGPSSVFNSARGAFNPRGDFITSNKQGFGDSGEPVVGFNIGINEAEQKLIYSDVDSAKGRFTKLISNTELFDAQFEDALSWFLSSKLAMALKRDARLMTTNMQIYEAKVAEAKGGNVNEGTNTLLEPPPDFIRARY